MKGENLTEHSEIYGDPLVAADLTIRSKYKSECQSALHGLKFEELKIYGVIFKV